MTASPLDRGQAHAYFLDHAILPEAGLFPGQDAVAVNVGALLGVYMLRPDGNYYRTAYPETMLVAPVDGDRDRIREFVVEWLDRIDAEAIRGGYGTCDPDTIIDLCFRYREAAGEYVMHRDPIPVVVGALDAQIIIECTPDAGNPSGADLSVYDAHCQVFRIGDRPTTGDHLDSFLIAPEVDDMVDVHDPALFTPGTAEVEQVTGPYPPGLDEIITEELTERGLRAYDPEWAHRHIRAGHSFTVIPEARSVRSRP